MLRAGLRCGSARVGATVAAGRCAGAQMVVAVVGRWRHWWSVWLAAAVAGVVTGHNVECTRQMCDGVAWQAVMRGGVVPWARGRVPRCWPLALWGVRGPRGLAGMGCLACRMGCGRLRVADVGGVPFRLYPVTVGFCNGGWWSGGGGSMWFVFRMLRARGSGFVSPAPGCRTSCSQASGQSRFQCICGPVPFTLLGAAAQVRHRP